MTQEVQQHDTRKRAILHKSQGGNATQCTRHRVANEQSTRLNLNSPFSPHTARAGDDKSRKEKSGKEHLLILPLIEWP